MTNFLLAAELLAASAFLLGSIYVGVRWRHRRSGPRNLGTVSEHWLTVHRAEN